MKNHYPQPTFACSKSIMETPKNVWNMFKVIDVNDIVQLALLLTLNIFHIVQVWTFHCWHFEQVNGGWDCSGHRNRLFQWTNLTWFRALGKSYLSRQTYLTGCAWIHRNTESMNLERTLSLELSLYLIG